MIKLNIEYFAQFRDLANCSTETIELEQQTAAECYQLIRDKYHFPLEIDDVKVAINDDFAQWQTLLNDGDSVVFIPPVAGG